MSELPTVIPELTFEEWELRFKPIRNHIDPNAAADGRMYETFGAEVAFVFSRNTTHPGTVWTIVECDDEDAAELDEEGDTCAPSWLITDGFHLINRIGYFVTELPFEATSDAPYLNATY